MAGLGTTVATGATILGSGAFTNVTAERNVSVNVAQDDLAFLRLDPLVDKGLDNDDDGDLEITERSSDPGQMVKFELPGGGDGENAAAEGLGSDSVYEFHDLLGVRNWGTQPVQVHSTYDGTNLADIALVSDDGVLRDDPPVVGTGDILEVGLYVDTHGSTTGEFDETLTIVADQPDE
ncbi:hypothetical protein [Halobacterium sp. R2-5]|uniref:hypothetical protein n=1 Tax=Halobacterium sp. R2-5 TaxID=2715751 RepID=UPI001420A76E|nr:hypothetical protein [Halobacterium sp. R2-5]NIB98091.1 hypothetical protein [Halobacterium sp. R2-5]